MPIKSNRDNDDGAVAAKRFSLVDPDRVISMIPLRPYHNVADIGCGSGYFSVPLAKYVSQGKLYAMDTDQGILETCREQLLAVNLSNVEVLRCGEKKLPLDEGSLDGALVAFVLNETKNKKSFMAEAGRLLEKGGWLAVLEWYGDDMNEGPPLKQRVSVEAAKGFGEGAGLRFVSQRDLNGKNYLMLFRK